MQYQQRWPMASLATAPPPTFRRTADNFLPDVLLAVRHENCCKRGHCMAFCTLVIRTCPCSFVCSLFYKNTPMLTEALRSSLKVKTARCYTAMQHLKTKLCVLCRLFFCALGHPDAVPKAAELPVAHLFNPAIPF